MLRAERVGGLETHTLTDNPATRVREDVAVLASHERGEWVDDRVDDNFTPFGHLDRVKRLPFDLERCCACQCADCVTESSEAGGVSVEIVLSCDVV